MTSDATAKASAAAAADGKKSSSSSSFSARSFLLSAVLAFCATRLYQKVTVYQQPFNKADFAHGKYNIKEIPVTYYHVDRIAEVLPEWTQEFRLYRVYPNETFDLDESKVNSMVRAKALLEECPWESVLCKPCFDPARRVQEVSTQTIFREKKWYASFAKMNDETVEMLWNLLKLPFSVNTAQLEHAFISNLATPIVTAGFHANPMTNSVAIQFTGHKSWVFFTAGTFLNQLSAFPAAPILLPRRVPKDEPIDVYVYTSQPGDLLFFPESHAHTVFTHDGPSVMVTYRKLFPMNILRQPFTWLAASWNNYRSPLVHSAGRVAGNDLQQQSVPEKAINEEVYANMDKLCDGGVTEFDADMLRILKDEYNKLHGTKL